MLLQEVINLKPQDGTLLNPEYCACGHLVQQHGGPGVDGSHCNARLNKGGFHYCRCPKYIGSMTDDWWIADAFKEAHLKNP